MHEYNFNLVRVIDGDSVVVDIDLGFDVWIKNESIRLSGIDTPESRTRDKVEKIFGNIAKSRVQGFLESEKAILRSKEYAKGKFGRILGDFINEDGVSLCETLLEEHLCVKYLGQNKADVKAQHLENQAFLIESGMVTIPEELL